MKNALLLLLAALLGGPALGQSAPAAPPSTPYYATRLVQGRVTEFTTRAPLANVTVYLKNTTDSAVTDDAGRYVLRVPRTARVGLYFYRSGYVTLARRIERSRGKNVRMWHGTSLLMDSLLQQHRADQTTTRLPFAAADTVRRITLSGRVTDRATGTGLAGVELLLATTGQTATTDANGRYQLVRVPEKELVRVRLLNYQPQMVSVAPQPALDVALERYAAPAPPSPPKAQPPAATDAQVRQAQARLDAERAKRQEKAARMRQRDF